MNPGALASRIEDAGLNASAPAQQRWLDGWLLRLSPGKAKRARCINALGAGRLELAERLQAAREAYREADLPLIMRVTPFTQPSSLDKELAQLGWRRFDDSCVMVWPSFAFDALPEPKSKRIPEPVDADAYAQIVGELRGSAPAQRLAHAMRLRMAPVTYRGFVLRDGADVLACGQLAQEGDLVGLYDVFTAAAARRQGHASDLCRWLLAQAATTGARHAYLQVEASNEPARTVYQRMGFVDAYTYHYRTPEVGAV